MQLMSLLQVFDKDIGQDKRLGIAKLPLIDLPPETVKEIEVRLQPALDMLKIKDKKDRGSIILKVCICLSMLFCLLILSLFYD